MLKNYVFKLLRLYGMWSIILFVGGNGHLWFLKSISVSVVIVYCLYRMRLKDHHVLIISFFLYCVGCLIESYSGLLAPYSDILPVRIGLKSFDFVFGTVKNGVTFGLVFVALGAFLAHSLPKVSLRMSLFGFFVSMVLFGAEVYLLKEHSLSSGNNLRLFQILAVFFLFLICLKIPLKHRTLYRRLRIVSIMIYFLHNFVSVFMGMGLDFMNYRLHIQFYDHQFFNYQLVFTIPVVTAAAVLIVKLSEKNRWMRYFYS